MVALQRLRVHRSAVLILLGLALIVAGLWVVAAAILGATIGAGIGLAVTGLAALLTESLSEDAQ